MARTSPCFYIAPTAISVSPNANGSASDIAVNVVRGAKIKVYSPGVPALGYSDVSFQQWTLTGRNRRLADNTKPYSIYARLAKSNKEDGYLVFAPKVASGTEWLDKYAYVTVGGLATGTANKNSEDYWYVKLGEVSLPTNNARTVTLDTGILGTDKFNTDWNIDPDQMPLRIELSATIDAKDAGDKPYVEWDKKLTLKANLLEGWANANVQRFHHFTIQRNTGNESSDKTYNYPPDEKSDSENPSSGRKMPNGSITLSHARGTDDVFNGTVSSIWTVIAWGLKANVADNTSSSSSTSGTVTANVYEKLAEKSINIMAETGEQYALEMSSSVVNYDPSSGTYNPANGIDVMVRATDQRGKVFKLTNAQLGAASLFVQYSVEHPEVWSECVYTDTANAVAKANIPIEAFKAKQNVNVRIVKAHYLEIYRSQIAFIRKGEKGDKGEDAVTYGVQLSSTYEVSSDAKKHAGIKVAYTKTTGMTVSSYGNVQVLGAAKVYADGTEIKSASDHLNSGYSRIIFDYYTFDGTNNTASIGTASVITVELLVGGTVVATANYSNGKQGDGVVMAYKHADTQPDAPTGTDPEYPGDGWSLSPDAATAGEKVTDVRYGGYESGTYDGTNKGTDATAKEWAEAEDDGRTWMKSPSGLSYNYGYAMMKVSFITQYDNTTVDVEIKAYSEQNYDLVEVWALDTAPSTGTSFRGQGLAHASGNGVEQAYSFTVAKAGRHFICVTYAKDISGDDNGDYGLFRLDLSDNEVAVSDTVWMSQAKVSGGKCVLPWSTPVKINGADGSAATVYTIETVGNSNNSGTLTDASTILVTLDGNLKLYKTVGSEKTEDSKPPQCWRLTVGGENVDGTRVFDKIDGNNIVTYEYYNKYNIDSNGNSTAPGSATISVYRDSSMSELLASLVVPISLNPGAIVNVDAKLGKIESTTASMKNDMNGMQGTIETIKQGQGQISLKVQDLQNGGVDTSKPHTSSQVDFRTLDGNSFYPVMIRFKDDGGVRHTVEINRPLDGTYGSSEDYMTHGNGFSFRLIFSDIANGWGTNEDGQLRIESISQRWTEPTDTPICPKIEQYYPFSFMLVWLRGGSKYDITVDCTDAYISGIWPYMMQVASNPSWVPDAVRLAPDTWTTAQVNAQGGNPYNMLRKDNGGYYADVDNEYLYRFGELAAGNTFAIVGQPRDSKVWFLATWHITSVSGSKVYVDVSTYGLLWQTQNPLGIRMKIALGYIKTGASYPKSTWDSQNGFGASENVDNTAVHADWGVPRAILVIGKESSTTNGVYRDRAVLEAVQSCTEGSSVSFYSNTYFDASPLYGTDGRKNVKPNLLATGIDIKSRKIIATTDNFVVRNNSGVMTFYIDKDGNIVGEGNASFKGSVTAKTFTLESENFYVDNNGKFKLNMTNFSVDENGNITAKGGHISFFNFDEEGMASGVILVSDSSQNKIAQRGLGLSSNNISVSGSANQRVSSVFWGNGHIDSRFAGSDKNYIVHRVGSTSSASTFYNYIKLEKLGNGSDSFENNPEHAALGIETQGDFCLAALGGPSLFAGMCFASSTGGSFTADKKHCFYLCSGGTFNMPSDPPDGMLIVVIQTRDRIDFNAGNGHRFQSGTYNSTSFTSDSAGQWSLFYYNNGVWYTIYMTR